ncbi:MAG: SDR family oxidoreductase [Gemmatimonadales bacterium]|nr:MAG: SDR family oxidoreductase [Gemmatimonadales bacterium]
MPEKTDPPASLTSEPPDEFVAQGSHRSHGAAVQEFLDSVGTETQPAPSRVSGGLRGKVALITGASSGIGRAIALSFAESGIDVAFNYLDTGPESQRLAHQVATALRELDVRVCHRPCDVREPEKVGAFVGEVVEELGGLHFLVNNAGIGRDGALWRMADDDWGAVLDTNLSGAFYFIRAVAPIFRNQEWGKIVNVASVHGVRGEFGLANYISSKAGLIGLTRSAAVELGPKNINVNAVAPGYIRTTQLTEQVPAEILDRAREKSVLGRLGDPQDVAQLVLFLCSERARHITGAVIPVDGGYLL